MTRLTVCWTPPSAPPEGPVLSFLPPLAEEALARATRGPFLRARACSLAARTTARAAYLSVSAAIGASAEPGGPTLRAECGSAAASSWWYHPTAFKACELDPAFSRLIAIHAILEAALNLGASELETWGAPREIVEVLRAKFSIAEHGTLPHSLRLRHLLRAVAARGVFAVDSLLDIFAARASGADAGRADVLIFGYWDWSCWADGGKIVDRYFKAFPERLRERGRSVNWLCWLDPGGDPLRPRRGRFAAARDASRLGVVLMQSFLGPLDALKAALDLRPLHAYLRRRDRPAFRAAFRDRGLDLFPFFGEFLLRGFADASIPRAALVEISARRAAARLKPLAAVHFLEHYPQARACYAGVRAGAPKTLTVSVQHATFSADKTFYSLEAAREFRGEPDRLPVPTPDLMLAMGLKPREHFLSHGYPPERVLATGSPRFDHIRPPLPAKSWSGKGVRLLLVPALDLGMEAHMLEAARAAAEELPGVSLRLREHPFALLQTNAAYARAREGLDRSSNSLDEDFAWADAVLFTYSTVGEEAVLRGIPAWQWRPLAYDASALSEAADIPRFTSVGELRAALSDFRAGLGLPDEAARQKLLEQLFLAGDGGGAERAAAALDAALNARAE